MIPGAAHGHARGAWNEFSRGSAIRRSQVRGLPAQRGVGWGLGIADAVPVLARALEDPKPLPRGHAAWALRRIVTPEAMEALRGRAAADEQVRKEIDAALGG